MQGTDVALTHRYEGSIPQAPAKQGRDMEKLTTISRLGVTQTVDSNGQLHSANGEPSFIDAKGTGHWHNRGVLHREDGPAIDGRHVQIWYRHGKIHRDDDEPAIYEDQGRRVMYYKNDRPHRVFGPAVIEITSVGKESQFWINGQKYSDEGIWERDAAPLRAKESPQKEKLQKAADLIEKVAKELKDAADKKAQSKELDEVVTSAEPEKLSEESKAPESDEKTPEKTEEAPKKRRRKSKE